jgi:hypothetical protein
VLRFEARGTLPADVLIKVSGVVLIGADGGTGSLNQTNVVNRSVDFG